MTNGFDLNEEDLLANYREARDTEIQRLLDQYGSSLSEVRELYPKLTETIAKRQATTFPSQALFFTSTEAHELNGENRLLNQLSDSDGKAKRK